MTDRVVVPIARGLVRIGATPNWLTFAGLVLTVIGVVILLLGHPLAGAFVMAAGAAVDAFDGAVARLRGSSGPFGAFYDSVTDRLSDSVVFGAAAWLVRADPLLFAVAITAMGAAQVTPYIRAKAESLGWEATVGIIERAERVIILITAIGLGFLPVALWVLALGGVVTIAQRLVVVVRQARAT
ncbi:MAG: CDP-alcohol phosphatidyltransferase family protein [Gemmatimonadetes bacterium]|nr:CDP-alcohol phosphatidyltransferase family protein [Gemmatimonadota bacterium]